MQQILDLHIHSRYSRACSKDLTLANLDKTCRVKGIDIIGTGDFTHPAWFGMIKAELEEVGRTGLYKLKSAADHKIKFILSAEVALIYKDGGKVRRIHIVMHAPNIEAAAKLNEFLGKRYNIRSDGRPILGMSSPDLVKLCLSIDPNFLIYPAHIWTPWFSVFGSKSGFNTFEECFHDQTEHIYAYETGLSSDPEMNWRVSELDKYTLLSNSDAHSLANLGREANVMELAQPSYDEIYEAIKNKDMNKLKYSIEFYPEEGMYHLDGHRDCGVSFEPQATKEHGGICPACKKPLVIGVVNRVEELADRESGFVPKSVPGFKKLIELDKIIAETLGVKSRSAKKVRLEYQNLTGKLGSEMKILLKADLTEIAAASNGLLAEAVSRVREGRLCIKPGFDGQYGEVRIFSDEERK